MGIKVETINQIIDFRYERSTDQYFLFNYKKYFDEYQKENFDTKNCWVSSSDVKKEMFLSYNDILNILKDKNGSFKKIWIFEN